MENENKRDLMDSDKVSYGIVVLASIVEAKTGNDPIRGFEFKNDVFEIRPFYCGDCPEGSNCHEDDGEFLHDDDCPCNLPNFKCGDFDAIWYKHPGRGFYCDDINVDEFITIMRRCLESLDDDCRPVYNLSWSDRETEVFTDDDKGIVEVILHCALDHSYDRPDDGVPYGFPNEIHDSVAPVVEEHLSAQDKDWKNKTIELDEHAIYAFRRHLECAVRRGQNKYLKSFK
jgi:hypothetical protein